jgi:hypothetical protein
MDNLCGIFNVNTYRRDVTRLVSRDSQELLYLLAITGLFQACANLIR